MVGHKSIADAKRLIEYVRGVVDGKYATKSFNEEKLKQMGQASRSRVLKLSKLGVTEFNLALEYLVQTDQVEVVQHARLLKASGGSTPFQGIALL